MASKPPEIVQDGDPVLRGIAAEVSEAQFGTPELDTIITDMAAALDAERDGVAIAAPQVGIPLRIFLVRYDRLEPLPEGAEPPLPQLGLYINPEIIKTSRRQQEMDEGCLSVRRVYGKTFRHERATVRARLADGTSFTRGGGNILAQVFQHETDHLDGILFTDHAHELIEITDEQLARVREGTESAGHAIADAAADATEDAEEEASA